MKEESRAPPSEDDFARLETEHGPIGARLRMPRATLSLEELCQRLTALRVTWRLADLGSFIGDPGLVGRMRGAFGNVLAEGASEAARAGQSCTFKPPSAFEVLFRKQGRLTPGTDFPSPWVIGLDRQRGDLLVHLTLFGMACEWLPAAAESFTIALARVDWAGASRRFVPRWSIVSRVLGAVSLPLPEGEQPDHVVFTTLSPLVSSGAGARETPASVFTTLRWRLEGIARWHEARLEETDWGRIARHVAALEWRWIEADEIPWTRGSNRQDRAIPMKGIFGQLEVSGAAEDMAAALPLFRIATLVHAGADVAFGCGRLAFAAA